MLENIKVIFLIILFFYFWLSRLEGLIAFKKFGVFKKFITNEILNATTLMRTNLRDSKNGFKILFFLINSKVTRFLIKIIFLFKGITMMLMFQPLTINCWILICLQKVKMKVNHVHQRVVLQSQQQEEQMELEGKINFFLNFLN